MPFATNIAYLAYLSIRDVKQIGDAAENDAIIVAPNILERAAESRWLPVVLTAVAVLSLGWGAVARAAEYGPLSERLQVLASLLNSDERLAYALLGDVVFFSAFQGWLVEDDLARREPLTDGGSTLRTIARSVPFFGLAYYLYARPKLLEK